MRLTVVLLQGRLNSDPTIHRPTLNRMIRALDWVVDLGQVFLVASLPIISLLFARPDEKWTLPVAVALAFVAFVAFLALAAINPEEYLVWKSLTVVAVAGVGLNIVTFLAIFHDWFDVEDAQPPAAVAFMSVEGVRPTETANLFHVDVAVQGDLEALGGRQVWAANTYQAEPKELRLGDAASFSDSPCIRTDRGMWTCESVYLGGDDQRGIFNVYVMVANDRGLVGITKGWIANPGSGYFALPGGVDCLPPSIFDKPG
jgi:hypothetical protein